MFEAWLITQVNLLDLIERWLTGIIIEQCNFFGAQTLINPVYVNGFSLMHLLFDFTGSMPQIT